MKSFILIKIFTYSNFIWICSYFNCVRTSQKSLDNKNYTDSILDISSDIFKLVNDKESKNAELNIMLFENGHNDSENCKNNIQSIYYEKQQSLNEDDNSKTENYGKNESKNKNNLTETSNKLFKKWICAICKPFRTIDNVFEKRLYKVFSHIYNYRQCKDPTQKKSLKRSAYKYIALIFVIPGMLSIIGFISFFLSFSFVGNKLYLALWGQNYENGGETLIKFMQNYGGTDIFLLVILLSIFILVYILVKFIKYSIKLGRNEVKS
ncbi:Plasmodium exported protein, unknown function [Plasmodium malariae]|uniref:Fam-m protein n=1 Tax=Plasmodium malariae TaxID=5858 RepID=A0A1D3JKG2_PLAMA|nr:Plasmodium exported protein, unknown function [Plasmodium malariae]SBT87030.1 Plasmodium exported protein, unknown function [Plasmodium malariae]